jgi:hypothetical protein
LEKNVKWKGKVQVLIRFCLMWITSVNMSSDGEYHIIFNGSLVKNCIIIPFIMYWCHSIDEKELDIIFIFLAVFFFYPILFHFQLFGNDNWCFTIEVIQLDWIAKKLSIKFVHAISPAGRQKSPIFDLVSPSPAIALKFPRSSKIQPTKRLKHHFCHFKLELPLQDIVL